MNFSKSGWFPISAHKVRNGLSLAKMKSDLDPSLITILLCDFLSTASDLRRAAGDVADAVAMLLTFQIKSPEDAFTYKVDRLLQIRLPQYINVGRCRSMFCLFVGWVLDDANC